MFARILGAAVVSCALFFTNHPALARADLALVMAVDVSSSVNDDRFRLQREGLASGLESQAVLDAVANGANQTIELAIVEWSEEQSVLVDWTVIHTHAELDAVVTALRTRPRPRVGSMTNVGAGIASAIQLFDSAPLPADRKIIDVSGDGQQNNGDVPAEQMRDTAISKHITINGLPITSGDEPEVDRWYEAHVIGGDGAFMVVANGHSSFSDAMRMKLSLEIAGLTPRTRFAVAR